MIAILILTIVCSSLGLWHTPIIKALWLNTEDVVDDKKYYQIFTCALVHKNIHHMLTNTAIIAYVVGKLHAVISYNYIALVYVVSVVLASSFSLLKHCSNKNYTACGASGGVFGLMVFGASVGLPSEGKSALLACFLLINMLMEMQLQTAFIEHTGGAIAGVLCGMVYMLHTYNHLNISTVILALGLVFMLVLDTNKNTKK
jgi:membrane associated rhomboid family serine protease